MTTPQPDALRPDEQRLIEQYRRLSRDKGADARGEPALARVLEWQIRRGA